MAGGYRVDAVVAPAVTAGQIDDVTVLKDPEFVDPVSGSGEVARRKVTMTSVCDQQRKAVSGNHDSARVLLEHRQPPGALDMGERNLHGTQKVPAECQPILDKVAQNHAVDGRREPMMRRGQRVTRPVGILVAAVVHQTNSARGVIMRVCVALDHRTVVCPPGVPDPHSVQVGTGRLPHLPLQCPDPSDRPQPRDVAAGGLHRDTDRVVKAVLESTKCDE
jgi:hypothetical protein